LISYACVLPSWILLNFVTFRKKRLRTTTASTNWESNGQMSPLGGARGIIPFFYAITDYLSIYGNSCENVNKSTASSSEELVGFP
jgi:hypothetical protein